MSVPQWLEFLKEFLKELSPYSDLIRTVLAGLGVVLLFIVRWLWRKWKELWQKYKLLKQQLKEAETEPPEHAAAGASSENWQTIRAKWRQIRDRTEYQIELFHGNARNMYRNIDRYRYDHIAEMLRNPYHASFTVDECKALQELDRMALGLRSKRAATEEQVRQVCAWYKTLDAKLPQLSVDES
jgi:hypothetical protein